MNVNDIYLKAYEAIESLVNENRTHFNPVRLLVIGYFFLYFNILPIEGEMPKGQRGSPYFAACAWQAVMATMLYTSSIEQPRERSFTGRAIPWRIGPMASAPPKR